MKLKGITAVSIVLILVLSVLSYGDKVKSITTPPPFKESKKIVVVSFVTIKPDKDVSELGQQIAYNLATRLFYKSLPPLWGKARMGGMMSILLLPPTFILPTRGEETYISIFLIVCRPLLIPSDSK